MFHYNNVDNIQICMDVPFVDHPYLIGPRGRKCQHLMDRYKSLVHFPDTNRRQNGPKLNNVVINGSSKNAEELRFQLRSRTPIRLAVHMQMFPEPYKLAARMESAIAEKSLPIRISCLEDNTSAVLKTEWRNEDALINFCDEFLTPPLIFASENIEIFTMALTILPLINPWNPEMSHWIIEHIYDFTGCRVFYPPKEKFLDQPPSYFIKGNTAAGVLKAGKFMLGLTMFQVSFVIPNTININLEKTNEWQKEYLVHTTIQPIYSTQNNYNNENNCLNSPKFLHNRAILRSFEFCLNNVYFVRSFLLGFKKTIQSSFYNFMSDVKHLIPYTVFSDAQLYYPLYAIEDERSLNWDVVGDQFLQKFYGGPYSVMATPLVSLRQRKPSAALQSVNNLTARLQELLNINNNQMNELLEHEIKPNVINYDCNIFNQSSDNSAVNNSGSSNFGDTSLLTNSSCDISQMTFNCNYIECEQRQQLQMQHSHSQPQNQQFSTCVELESPPSFAHHYHQQSYSMIPTASCCDLSQYAAQPAPLPHAFGFPHPMLTMASSCQELSAPSHYNPYHHYSIMNNGNCGEMINFVPQASQPQHSQYNHQLHHYSTIPQLASNQNEILQHYNYQQRCIESFNDFNLSTHNMEMTDINNNRFMTSELPHNESYSSSMLLTSSANDSVYESNCVEVPCWELDGGANAGIEYSLNFATGKNNMQRKSASF